MPINIPQSDIAIKINENIFKKVFREIYDKCPELFTFATDGIIDRARSGLKLLCEGKDLPVDPGDYTRVGNIPVMSVGTGSIALDFYCRINKFDIEFPSRRQSSNRTSLTNKLVQEMINKLNEPNSQLMLMTLEVIIGMPKRNPLSKNAILDFVKNVKDKSKPPISMILKWEELDCFKCTVYCLFNYNTPTSILAEDVEIEELTPAGLESQMETYFFWTLTAGVLPKLTPLLTDLLFVKPAVLVYPVETIPNNPLLTDNSLCIYFKVNN